MRIFPCKHLIATVSMVLLIVCGCAKSQLTVADFIRPPSKILRFRDVHTIDIQKPSISRSDVTIENDCLPMYQQMIQDSFAKAFSHKPWYQIRQSNVNTSQSSPFSEQIQKSGFKWINPVSSEIDINGQHRLFSNITITQWEENDLEIQMQANLSIVILDAQGKEVYIQLFNNLSASERVHGKKTFTEQLCIHQRLAQKLFQPAVVKVVDEIYPRTIKQVMSIHDDSDIKGRLLLDAQAFPEALAHIEKSIKQKERTYIQQKNDIQRQYQQIEARLQNQTHSDEDIREKRIQLAKEKESKIDSARKFLSGDYKNYGTALEALGFIDEAVEYYEKAFTADPFNYMARLEFHRLIYFRKTSNKELELNQETIEQSLRRQDESL
ncbi:MAG: hypothetical protein HQK75_01970 [Candidatus Magnetomorum sp.]|nr:hypothetical protein [Candidatus Magnetomorum sp.]